MTILDPPEPTDVEDVIVIGVRPQPGSPKNDPPFEEQDEVDPDPIPEPGGGGGVWTEEEVQAENERQKECAAKEFERQLNEKEPLNKDRKEFISLIWNQAGQTATHDPRGGTGDRITGAEIEQIRQHFGISGSDLIGYTHNHPSGEYCTAGGQLGFDQVRTNAYPSENDWNATDALVPEEFRSNVTLYILGCDNQMRAFRYADRAKAERDRDQRARPPNPIAPDGCGE